MNGRLAKMLRKASGYRNATASQSPLKFPGIARLYRFPVLSKRATLRNVGGPFWPRKTVELRHNIMTGRVIPNGKFWSFEPVFLMAENPKTKVPETQFELMPVTKPVRREPGTPRGAYRALKRLYRTVGIRGLTSIAALHDKAINQMIDNATVSTS